MQISDTAVMRVLFVKKSNSFGLSTRTTYYWMDLCAIIVYNIVHVLETFFSAHSMLEVRWYKHLNLNLVLLVERDATAVRCSVKAAFNYFSISCSVVACEC